MAEDAARLRAWVEAAGGRLSEKVAVEGAEGEGQRGLFAREALEQGERVVEVPWRCVLHAQRTAEEACPLQEVWEAHPQVLEMQDEVLAMLLLHYRYCAQGAEGFTHYVRSLPQRFDTPLFWEGGDDEVATRMRGSAVVALTRMMRRQMQADWDALYVPLKDQFPHLPGFQNATLEDYVWAMTVVYSRAIGLMRPNVAGATSDEAAATDCYVRCLVPLVDMFNHDAQLAERISADDVVRLDPETDKIQFVAPAAVDAGAEIMGVYGPYCNSKLVYTYGFAVQDNPIKAVDFWPKMPAATDASPIAQARRAVLEHFGSAVQQSYDFSGSLRIGFISRALMATVRILQAEAEELSNLQQRRWDGGPISDRNERAACSSLLQLIQARIESFSTTADEDEEAIAALDLATEGGRRDRMALLALADEKRVLYNATDRLMDSMQMLDNADMQVAMGIFEPVDAPATQEAAASVTGAASSSQS